MESITLYTIHCPACNVLEKKLKNKNICFNIIDSEDILNDLGIESFPMMSINDGPLLNYKEAREWVDAQEVWE
jgi:hypothetical protein